MMKNNSKRPQGVLFEPYFQRKKRLEGPATTLSMDFNDLTKVNEDYILLGKNDKFQNNIRYKCRLTKSLDANEQKSPLKPKILQENTNYASDEYILLGNNSKFAKNVIYKPKHFPELTIETDKENATDDVSQSCNEAMKMSKDSTYDVNNEYILLGNNAKFSDNTIYRPKIWPDFIPNYDKEKENQPVEDSEESSVQAKRLEPAPFVDTSKFREPPKKSKKPVETAEDLEIKRKKKKKFSPMQEEARNEMKLILDDEHFRKQKAIDEKFAAEKESKSALKGEKGSVIDFSAEKSVKFQSPPPAPRSPKANSLQNEPDQKLLSLFHKAGISFPPRPMKELSEYQKNFTWKKPYVNSTGAENKKIFQTTTLFDTDPTYKDPVPKISEYQRNFQAWIPVSLRAPPLPPSAIAERKSHKGHKSKTEKAASSQPGVPLVKDNRDGSLSPSSGKSSDRDAETENDKEEIQNTKNLKSFDNSTRKTHFSNPLETQFHKSEYRASYKAPSKYDYRNNAWESSPSNKNLLTGGSEEPRNGDWYSEVLDLRHKAAEYRRRAQNTHFCSNHMAQLLADETHLWEHVDSDEPKFNLRDMRPAGISYNKILKQRFVSSHPKPVPPPFVEAEDPAIRLEDVPSDADVVNDPSEEGKCGAQTGAKFISPSASDSAIVVGPEAGVVREEENDEEVTTALELANDTREVVESPVGRVSTPELQDPNYIRHHFDRTTPIKGHLLISSSSPSPKASKHIDLEIDKTNNSIGNYLESSYEPFLNVESRPKHCVKTYDPPSSNDPRVLPPTSHAPCLQTFGRPSKDTHVLRSKENLTTTFAKSSSDQTTKTVNDNNNNNICMKVGNLRPKKCYPKLHPAGLNSFEPIPESMTSTYTVQPGKVSAAKSNPNEKVNLNEDFLSQSLESNSSLASEVLERTRKRLNFW